MIVTIVVTIVIIIKTIVIHHIPSHLNLINKIITFKITHLVIPHLQLQCDIILNSFIHLHLIPYRMHWLHLTRFGGKTQIYSITTMIDVKV